MRDRALLRAQAAFATALASGAALDVEAARGIPARRRCGISNGFDREARAHLRNVEARLADVSQVQFNLTAERGVAERRVEATQGVLARVRELGGPMKVFEDVGRGTVGFVEYAGGVATLSAEAGSFIGRLRIRIDETFAQAYFLGVQSTVIVLLTSLFTGMVISLESANQASSYGASSLVGGAVAYVSSRELGPMLTAVVVAGRAGAAMAAELGSMVVTEQIEALEALGLSPVQMLVVPRLVAIVCMLPLLTIIADIVSIIGGMYLAHQAAGISYDSFLTSARQFSAFGDYLKGMLKAVDLRDHHRRHRVLSGFRRARRRRRRRQSDDRCRRHQHHHDLRREFLFVDRAVRHDGQP